jgi:DNA-binding MarR family transcriptional regulator
MNGSQEREEQLVLELLDAVGKKNDVSQRHLARQMGVALGLANSYLKRCIRKGFIKITEAPANRYLYYLTPQGFAEKSRLTARYLANSFSFYRRAGESCERVFGQCRDEGRSRIILCGTSDLAEIATLRALEWGIDIPGIYDPHTERRRFAGKQVWRRTEDILPRDGLMLTDLNATRLMHEHLQAVLPQERLFVPDILRLE